ncbi:MAG: phosphodiester glycosidase family protein [Patescibacteria group bacterium]
MKKLVVLLIASAFLSVVAGSVFLLREQLPAGLSRRTLEIDDRHIIFDVIDLTAQGLSMSLMNDPSAPKNVKEWRSKTGADLVVNGAYFDEKSTPTGFYTLNGLSSTTEWPKVEDQQTAASYSFLVEAQDDRLELSYLPDAPRAEAPTNGFLSFPTLIANGQSLVKADTGLRAARTILAEDARGSVYLIIVEQGSISLYEAASWLLSQPEGFTLAGNLDGGPSTGVSYTDGKRIFDEPSAPVPNVIVGSK